MKKIFLTCLTLFLILLSINSFPQNNNKVENEFQDVWNKFKTFIQNNDSTSVLSLNNFPLLYNANGNLDKIKKSEFYGKLGHLFKGEWKDELISINKLIKVKDFEYNLTFEPKVDYKLKSKKNLYRAKLSLNNCSFYFTTINKVIKLYAVEEFWDESWEE